MQFGPPRGLSETRPERECLVGQTILQTGVPELVDGSDRAQDITIAGIGKEAHEADRSMPTCGKLCKCEGS